jgi:hypothetical protein
MAMMMMFTVMVTVTVEATVTVKAAVTAMVKMVQGTTLQTKGWEGRQVRERERT